jgi:hypothetical protein
MVAHENDANSHPIAAKSAHLFSGRAFTGAYLQPGFVDCNGKGVYRGANPPGGALLTV